MQRRFLRLTGLNILANITIPLAGLVDTAMLGHLPEIHFLAGVALGSVVFDILFWSFGFLRMGATGTTAQAMGRDDGPEVERILQRSLAIALASGALILLARVPLTELAFAVLSGDPAVESAGREYVYARLWGAPAALANLAFLGWFLGREESRLALAMTLVASLANVALNYLFIVEFGWAAQGAGYASMLSQYLMLGLALVFYAPRRSGAGFEPRQILDPKALGGLMKLQGDIFIRTLCLVSTFAVFTDFSARMGTLVLAANTLLVRLLTLNAYVVDGAAYAIESLAGRFHGEGNTDKLRRLLRLALTYGFVFAGGFALALSVLPRPVLGLLTSHAEVQALAMVYLPWLLAILILGAPAYVFDGFFLGLADGRVLRRSMLASLLVAFVPLSALALWRLDTHLLWFALTAFTLARGLTLGHTAVGFFRHPPASPRSSTP